MATHPRVDANMKADTNRVSDERAFEMHRKSELPAHAHSIEDSFYRAEPNLAPIAVIPQALANPPVQHNLRRILPREEGRALEMIGHAVDYLYDCYLYEGDDREIINSGGSTMKALGILAAARIQILQSLPLQESRTTRLWNALFHRSSGRNPERSSERSSDRGHDRKSQSAAVVPLPSSR
ncbi:MAG: hypothetical protein ABI076_06185 [Acidobacteriaceae bacterium]